MSSSTEPTPPLESMPPTPTITIKQLCSKIHKQLPKSVQTKLKNINKAGTCSICTTKRVSQTSRIIIEYADVVKNNLTIEQLETHRNGVVIDIPFREYERIRDIQHAHAHTDANANAEQNTLSPIDQYILNNIGGISTHPVVAIVTIIKENGSSGSSQQRIDLERLKQEIEMRKWEPIYETKQEDGVKQKNKNKGNANWGGHYFYNVSGGSQESFKSHTSESEPQIFTTSKGFMSNEEVVTDVIASLTWQLIHCYDISTYTPNEYVFIYKQTLEQHLKSKMYMGKSCFDHLEMLENIHDGKLISPITRECISIHAFDFEKTLNTDNLVNISHNEPVNKHKIYFCPEQNVMLSDYRPGNLFWDTHLGNMQQQSFTIQEYWSEMDKRNSIRAAQLQSKKANTLEHNSLDI